MNFFKMNINILNIDSVLGIDLLIVLNTLTKPSLLVYEISS